MDKIFYENLIKLNIIKKSDKLSLGVSGGADSMYLFYNFMDLKEDWNLDIIVCHLNHGIRETAKRDEEFVKKSCQAYGIKFISKTVNMDEFAREKKFSSEEAGRILRYEFFRENSQGRKILTAHNANDRVETVLFNIMRGTGLKGLSGITHVNGDIYRPLINIKREEIEDYLHKNKLQYFDDETNFEEIYTRNKIRLGLIPELKKFNPYIINSLLRLSDNVEEANEFIGEILEENYNNCLGDNFLIPSEIIKLKKLIAQEVIKKYLEENFYSENILNRFNILAIYDLCLGDSGRRIDLGKNISARRSYDKIYIEEVMGQEEKTKKGLSIGRNATDFGEIFITRDGEESPEDSFIKVIDYDKIKGSLKVRKRAPGDRFKPLGMKNSKKLKDYFIDRKVDRLLRDEIGLICDDEKIIYILGMDISEDVKIDKKTKNKLVLEVKNVRY
ncbi:PP-loop family protein [Trichomonas vaginalis G3]|uniref:tRNA(Ile)-lysidine synthetase n=2 Tax=Trichomonas vaginalis TaxID=5722 RepID=A2FJA9_TRIV3|nr:tRNA thio-modification [Trichomonas vaginalis G3]AHZ59595.1 PP-loop family protein [Trichomonas vaginalis]EAX95023.1 PP-loop family protein [Trichomonas vaginalis G3]KAI5537870.1 tRNA thio-modification [Trichomonas vaginalis G3]|eukprot:XP_001307953.1 PP-loop family protein [Trichomonas vaginalis G3]